MHFVVFASDKPGVGEVRAKVRPLHRQYLRKHDHPVKVLLGGPTLNNESKAMNGTMLVVEAEWLEQVVEFVENDPYNKAEIFETLEVRPWVWGIGAPEE